MRWWWRRAGASGIVAAEYVLKAPPETDVMLFHHQHRTQPTGPLFQSLPYDYVRDFVSASQGVLRFADAGGGQRLASETVTRPDRDGAHGIRASFRSAGAPRRCMPTVRVSCPARQRAAGVHLGALRPTRRRW